MQNSKTKIIQRVSGNSILNNYSSTSHKDKESIEKHRTEHTFDIREFQYQHLIKQIFSYFERSLKQNPQAIKELSNFFAKGSSRYCDTDIIEQFHIGYCDTGFRKLLGKGTEGQKIKELLTQIGLLTKDSKAAFQDCLVFPITDSKERIVNACAYSINSKPGADELCLFPNDDELFHSQTLEYYSEIIVCQSVMDALSFLCSGFMNVTACCNRDGLNQKQAEHLSKHNIQKVYLAFRENDNGNQNGNEHGGNGTNKNRNEAVQNTAILFAKHSIQTFQIEFPDNNTVSQYIQRVRAPKEDLKLLIQTALPIGDHKIKTNPQSPFSLCDDPNHTEQENKDTDLQWEKRGSTCIFSFGTREYAFYGLEKNLNPEHLKLRVRIAHGALSYTDNALDFFSHKTIRSLIHNAAKKLEVKGEIIQHDLDRILPILEEEQKSLLGKVQKNIEIRETKISPSERQEALDYLKDPELIKHIIDDFEKTGLLGEDQNALIGYLSALSRKDEQPLAVIIQSSSGAGKTTFMDAVLALMPEEDCIKFSALTGQSLYYMQSNLKNKILALVEEEGAQKASYSLKLLQSEGILSIAAAAKDPDTGRMQTQRYEVEGPVMIFIATTNFEIDEELQNRCILLTVNESKEQTQRILEHQRQMETLEGLIQKNSKAEICKRHHVLQKLLRPIHVINPYAEELSFYAQDHRARRHQKKYLSLIRMVAFLHQYQRPLKTLRLKHSSSLLEYIEVTLEDIDLANKLAVKIFGVSLDDLPVQTRTFLEKLYSYVKEQCKTHNTRQADFRFCRRELCEATETGMTQIGIHLKRLEQYDYAVKHKGKRGKLCSYELVYKGEGKRDSLVALGIKRTQAN